MRAGIGAELGFLPAGRQLEVRGHLDFESDGEVMVDVEGVEHFLEPAYEQRLPVAGLQRNAALGRVPLPGPSTAGRQHR